MADMNSFELDAHVMREALAVARADDPDIFRKQELTWLEENNVPAHQAVTGFFGTEIAKRGPEVAQPGYQGALLGSYVLRLHAKKGLADYKAIRSNQAHHFTDKRLVYAREFSADDLGGLLGANAGEAVGDIKHPVARTLSGVVLALGLKVDLPETLNRFLPPDERFKLKPPARKRMSGSH